MSLKFAILSLIAEKPQHGYAVRRELEARVLDIREIGFGQVYQVLQSLEKSGFAVGRRDPKSPRRIVFSVTDRGRDALGAWLRGGHMRPRGFHDDIFLRLLFASPDVLECLRELIREQVRIAREELAFVVDERRRLRPDAGFAEVSRRLFLEAEILHREADLRALEMAKKVFDLLASGIDPASVVEAELPEGGERVYA